MENCIQIYNHISSRSLVTHKTEGKYLSIDKEARSLTEGYRDMSDENSYGRRIDAIKGVYEGSFKDGRCHG
jgi:hypothetical protein